jgi:hypothetical protein
MTLRQIAAIHFDGHGEAAKKRVQRLKMAGYIRVRSRMANEPAIHILTRKAFDVLNQRRMLDRVPQIGWAVQEKRLKVSDLTLRHELGVMDFKGALFTAVRIHPGLRIVEFSTWPQRLGFKTIHPVTGAKVHVKPDGFICLEETRAGAKKYHLFFLEADCSSETLGTLDVKLRCYRNFYRLGGFAQRLKHATSEYRRFPFRVLVICKSGERRGNLARRLCQSKPPIKTFACLATFEEITSDLFSTIGLCHPNSRTSIGG